MGIITLIHIGFIAILLLVFIKDFLNLIVEIMVVLLEGIIRFQTFANFRLNWVEIIAIVPIIEGKYLKSYYFESIIMALKLIIIIIIITVIIAIIIAIIKIIITTIIVEFVYGFTIIVGISLFLLFIVIGT